MLPATGAPLARLRTDSTSASPAPSSPPLPSPALRYCGLYETRAFLATFPESGSSTPASILIMVVLPRALAPATPRTSPRLTLPAPADRANPGCDFDRAPHSTSAPSDANSSAPAPGADADASSVNALSRKRTLSPGRYPSRNALMPTFVESMPDTMPYAAGSP